MSVVVTGMKELQAKMLKLGEEMSLAVDEGVFVTAQGVRTTAIKSIQDQSPGKLVNRSRQGGGTRPHIAAAEGYAPNTDTGKLVASIDVEKIKDGEYEIGTNLEYGEFLEMGTKKMRPRPWLIPALDANKNNLLTNIGKTADIRIKRLSK